MQYIYSELNKNCLSWSCTLISGMLHMPLLYLSPQSLISKKYNIRVSSYNMMSLMSFVHDDDNHNCHSHCGSLDDRILCIVVFLSYPSLLHLHRCSLFPYSHFHIFPHLVSPPCAWSPQCCMYFSFLKLSEGASCPCVRHLYYCISNLASFLFR